MGEQGEQPRRDPGGEQAIPQHRRASARGRVGAELQMGQRGGAVAVQPGAAASVCFGSRQQLTVGAEGRPSADRAFGPFQSRSRRGEAQDQIHLLAPAQTRSEALHAEEAISCNRERAVVRCERRDPVRWEVFQPVALPLLCGVPGQRRAPGNARYSADGNEVSGASVDVEQAPREIGRRDEIGPGEDQDGCSGASCGFVPALRRRRSRGPGQHLDLGWRQGLSLERLGEASLLRRGASGDDDADRRAHCGAPQKPSSVSRAISLT